MTPRERTVTSGLRIILKVGRVPVRVEQEIEPPHLVGAVVRAIPRPHAAVVDHVVEAFVAVNRGLHRADVLARRVLAVHAQDRLVEGLRALAPGPRSSGRRGSSASRGRGPPAPCPPPGCCSPPGRRPRRHCSRCTRSDRSPCPRRAPRTCGAGTWRGRASAARPSSGRRGGPSRARPASPPGRCAAPAPARGRSRPSSSGPGCRRCARSRRSSRPRARAAVQGASLVRSA